MRGSVRAGLLVCVPVGVCECMFTCMRVVYLLC